MPQFFRLFIDETGTHGLTNAAIRDNRYFGVLGCIIPMRIYKLRASAELTRIKSDFFGHTPTSPVVLHKFDMDQRIGPFESLGDHETRYRFNKEMTRFYRDLDFRIVSVVLDKETHRKRHGADAWHPYKYCAKVLFERFCLFLKKVNGVGDAYAEARSQSEDGALRVAWRSFSANGTAYIGGQLARKLIGARPLTFKKKCDGVEGIEIADMLAQHALEETLIDAGLRQGFRNAASKYVRKALADKWDTHRGSKEIKGCGRIFLR